MNLKTYTRYDTDHGKLYVLADDVVALKHERDSLDRWVKELKNERDVFAAWIHNALNVLETIDPDECEDAGQELNRLKHSGAKLVKACQQR